MISRVTVSLSVSALTAAALIGVTTVSSQAQASGTRHADASAVRAASNYATGLIVKTTSGSVSTSVLKAADAATSRTVTTGRPTVTGFKRLDFDKPVTIASAQKTADALEKRSDVVSAVPNRVMTAATASPVKRNDSYYSRQYNLWDTRGSYYGAKLPANGGYSIKAPDLWRATTGSSAVTVAVVDTGITTNPDLEGQTVAGYDFLTGGDGVIDHDSTPGRDSDPSDPGDWVETGQCDDGSGGATEDEPSSWHGTFVAGEIAALANNNRGVVGVASSSKVQPIRVLGSCGGDEADVAAAIVWAAGGTVSGVPANPTPAKVINLSLAGTGQCDSVFTSAIASARSHGAEVVAAAGNESTISAAGNVSHKAYVDAPANCAGAIGVTATDPGGQRAFYSNVGTSSNSAYKVDIAAPGGSAYSDDTWILGLSNTGTTTPGSPTYEYAAGTSMAAPEVSGGIALLYSLGYTRAQVDAALPHMVSAFPTYPNAVSAWRQFNCTVANCGAGILNLGTVPAPYYTTSISGTMSVGHTVKAVTQWNGGPTLSYRWLRNGVVISGASKSSYKLTSADKGKSIVLRVSGVKTHFKTLTKLSAARTVS